MSTTREALLYLRPPRDPTWSFQDLYGGYDHVYLWTPRAKMIMHRENRPLATWLSCTRHLAKAKGLQAAIHFRQARIL